MADKKDDTSKVNIFWKIPMFEFLDAEELDRLQSLCSSENLSKGEYVFLECDPPRKLYVVVKGEMIVEMAYAGEVFGEEAIFDGEPYPLTAQALGDVELLSVTRTDFFTFLRDNPDVAGEIEDAILTAHGMPVRHGSKPLEPTENGDRDRDRPGL